MHIYLLTPNPNCSKKHPALLLVRAPEDYKVLVGAFNHNLEDAEDSIDVIRLILHEDYDLSAPGIPNDIGLMELAWDADLANSNVGLAVLPRRGEDFAGTDHCWVAGWGRLGQWLAVAD